MPTPFASFRFEEIFQIVISKMSKYFQMSENKWKADEIGALRANKRERNRRVKGKATENEGR